MSRARIVFLSPSFFRAVIGTEPSRSPMATVVSGFDIQLALGCRHLGASHQRLNLLPEDRSNDDG